MFPTNDWQFWVVSGVVLGVVVGTGRSLFRKRKRRGRTKVQLTIERHTLDKPTQDETER